MEIYSSKTKEASIRIATSKSSILVRSEVSSNSKARDTIKKAKIHCCDEVSIKPECLKALHRAIA